MAARELQLGPKERNYYRFSAPIFDFEFKREGTEILLAFSAKRDVPSDLLVRLYEVRGDLLREARRAAVVEDSDFRGKERGFDKSNRYVVIDAAKSFADVARIHGLDDARLLQDHFNNRLLRTFRGGDQLEADDLLFVPQVRDLDAIPLGEVLPVEDVSETVEDGGHRHLARWNIESTSYDPLDPEQWVSDSLVSTGATNHPASNVREPDQRRLWFPQFAVLTQEGTVLAVSPTPPELARETEYELVENKDPHAFAVVHNRASRFLDGNATRIGFEVTELPLGAYGALAPSGTEEG